MRGGGFGDTHAPRPGLCERPDLGSKVWDVGTWNTHVRACYECPDLRRGEGFDDDILHGEELVADTNVS